ncbi:protein of unknown function [Alkalispirochaeta americana]|uniref:DUF4168 domain-containing protein n=2 Tax=Alkalispirochaeta americana TaxID=159291 RepID=A0A1N6UD55_9SPIO|nr:protein of unknown function [Alkalispirochaeta americana]
MRSMRSMRSMRAMTGKSLITALTVVLALGVVGGISAQTEQPAPAADVSGAEIEQFAQALQGIQGAQEEIQQDMQRIVGGSSLGEERFGEIHDSVNTTGDVPGDASEGEVESYSAIVQELSAVQQDLQMQMASIVEEQGLDVERFNAIVMAIQQDEQLWERVQGSMN